MDGYDSESTLHLAYVGRGYHRTYSLGRTQSLHSRIQGIEHEDGRPARRTRTGGTYVKFGLTDATIRAIHRVLMRHHEVECALLYGSRAKGTFKHGSDIDLTLIGGNELTDAVLYGVADELDDLLLPYEIDLSLFSEITDTAAVDHIQRRGMVFFSRDHAKDQA